MLRGIFLLFLFFLGACAPSDPLSDLQTGERGRVVRVIDGDALVLSTGQSVRLIGIEAPAGPYKDRDAAPFYAESRRILEDLSLGREVELRYAGLTRDRYDRALAHVITTDRLGARYWLNAEMIRRGGARVRVYPDTALLNGPLIPLEDQARKATQGIWSLEEYRIIRSENIPEHFDRFRIVEGAVVDRAFADQPRSSCRLVLAGSKLMLDIRRSASSLCQTPSGSMIRARGWVNDMTMEITHPLNMTVLKRPE